MRSFIERHFEIVDLGFAVLVSGFIILLGHRFNGDAALLSTLEGNRLAVYGAITALFGTIFGFALTAMSIVLAVAESPRLSILRNSRHWITLWRVFAWGIRVFVAVAFVGIAAMIFDKDRNPHPYVTYAVIFSVFVGMSHIYRVLWAFEKLTFIMSRPDQDAGQRRGYAEKIDCVRV